MMNKFRDGREIQPHLKWNKGVGQRCLLWSKNIDLLK